jgi:hypothetical protein
MSRKLKYIILTCFILGVSSNFYSQYKYGILAGAGASNYLGPDLPSENQTKIGLVAGLFYEYQINYTFSIGSELKYEQKGCAYNYYPRIATNVAIDSRLHYFTLPLYMKANLDFKAYSFFYGGASASYRLNSTNKVRVTEYGYEIAAEPYFSHTLRNFDASVFIGFGINFREFIFDMRYHHGIIGIYEGTNIPEIRNRFVSSTIGYTMYTKKVQYCVNPRRRMKDL